MLKLAVTGSGSAAWLGRPSSASAVALSSRLRRDVRGGVEGRAEGVGMVHGVVRGG